MHDLLQHIDSEYYRSALLIVARTEIERLRRARSASIDVERLSKTLLGVPPAAEGAVSPNSTRAVLPPNVPHEVRHE